MNVPGVGSFGAFFDGATEICKSVEREWLNNKPYVSCVPAGLYKMTKHNSPSKGKCYCLTSKEQGVTLAGPSVRTHVLIHIANWPEDLLGCIGPGEDYHPSRWGVMNSTSAFNDLMDLLDEYVVETKNNLYLQIIRSEA